MCPVVLLATLATLIESEIFSMNFQEFIEKNPSLSMEVAEIDRRYDGSDSKWGAGATHWGVVLRWRIDRFHADSGVRSHALEYSMGSAHVGGPQLDDILQCLHTDASCASDCGSFESWADDFGYDSDSRKAESIYKACLKTDSDLSELFGAEVYQAFLALEEEC